MTTRKKILSAGLAICFLSMFFVLSACGSRTPYLGKYTSEEGDEPPDQRPFIELKEDGSGVFFMADEEADFQWSVKGKEIRLHVKPSGVITGSINNDRIEIKFPGSKIMVFKKAHPAR